MKSLSLITALVVSKVVARPAQQDGNLQIRQTDPFSMIGKYAKRPGKFLGDERATAALNTVAKSLGANRNNPGSIGMFASFLNGAYGEVSAPADAAARIVTEKTRTDVPGAKTLKVRYGPYKVPSAKKKNLLGDAGMLYNHPAKNLAKPCSGECTIIGMNAGLEYLDGTNANINTGLWLHHMVLFNIGEGRKDFTCAGRDVSVPHSMVGGTPHNSERFFGSGNERTDGFFREWSVRDAGYKLKSTDKFAGLIELMNENAEDKVVWLTMTYDILDGHPFKDDIKPVWFDARQCGTSEVNPPPGLNQFSLSYNWTSTIDGEVIGSIEHLHDGGARMTLDVDGKITCDSEALYATKPEYIAQQHQMDGGHGHIGAAKHISEQKLCHGNTLTQKEMKKGQVWTMKAYYDFTKNPGNKHDDGDWEEVMGIAIMYVRTRGGSGASGQA